MGNRGSKGNQKRMIYLNWYGSLVKVEKFAKKKHEDVHVVIVVPFAYLFSLYCKFESG